MKTRIEVIDGEFELVTVVIIGPPCAFVRQEVMRLGLRLADSEDFIRFSGTEAAKAYGGSGTIFHVWGDHPEYRVAHGMTRDQRAEGRIIRGERDAYQLLYRPSDGDPLLLSDRYEIAPVLCMRGR